MLSSFPYFALKLYCFLVIRLLVCVCIFFPYLLIEFFFRCFGKSCFVCIIWSCLDILFVFLLSPLPSAIFPRIVCFNCCVAFSFSSQHIPGIFPSLIFFVCCHRFFYLCFQFNYHLFLFEFFTPVLGDSFHGSLSDSKSAQVSRTLLSILTDRNNAVVWMVSTRPVISKSSSLEPIL